MAKASDNQFPKVTFAESAAPSTPAAGLVVAYAKADGKLYIKDDAGTETDLTATGGGGSSAPFLDYVVMDHASSASYTQGATKQAIDGANLKMDFTGPTSGNVLFELSGYFNRSSSRETYFYLATAAAPTTVLKYIAYRNSSFPAFEYIHLRGALALTAGVAHSIVIGWESGAGAGNNTLTYGQGGQGQVIFSASALP